MGSLLASGDDWKADQAYFSGSLFFCLFFCCFFFFPPVAGGGGPWEVVVADTAGVSLVFLPVPTFAEPVGSTCLLFFFPLFFFCVCCLDEE